MYDSIVVWQLPGLICSISPADGIGYCNFVLPILFSVISLHKKTCKFLLFILAQLGQSSRTLSVDVTANVSTRSTGHRFSHVRITAGHMFNLRWNWCWSNISNAIKGSHEIICMVIKNDRCEQMQDGTLCNNEARGCGFLQRFYRYQLANSSYRPSYIFIVLVAEKFTIDQMG